MRRSLIPRQGGFVSVFIHPKAICESATVGEGSRVWAFAHVFPHARIGRDANICDHVLIENDVVIGDRVTVKSGVQLWDGIDVGDDVFIGPNATFTNDPFPRSKHHIATYPRTTIEAGASVGGGAVILPGIRIGRSAMVGAGAVVTKNVPPFAIVRGNPAHIAGYVSNAGQKLSASTRTSIEINHADTDASSYLIRLTSASDMRGSLIAAEFESLPFVPQRFFVVFSVPSQDVRGEHAHRRCEQLLVCVNGSVRAIIDDGRSRYQFLLDSPDVGLYMPAMTWGTQFDYSPDAVLAVFASLPYDDADYIRSYDDFRGALA